MVNCWEIYNFPKSLRCPLARRISCIEENHSIAVNITNGKVYTMSEGSLVCGKVIRTVGRSYLVQLADGTKQYVHTDGTTYGNGKAHWGETVFGWVDKDGHASVLPRALYVPVPS